MKSKVFAIDFDGTIVKHEYPNVGRDVPHAVRVIRRIISCGHKVILFTMRHGDTLEDAVAYMNIVGIDLLGVNENPHQSSWSLSRKVYAHIYIDDASLGCPLMQDKPGTRPWVDWMSIEKLLLSRGELM